VDKIKNDYHWSSVIVFGHYEEITDDLERERVLAALFAHLPQITSLEAKMIGADPPYIVFRLRISSISSVFERLP
jgi:nitroimidazol reductase NimA-like FMN-containing flavoprotein (pyridoxamine 5'-phosphate oxidase superfamily)